MLTSTDQLSAALYYIGQGMYVFPAKPKSKRPDPKFAPHGFKDSFNDAETVKLVWDGKGTKDDNVCIETGSKSNLYVVDMDVEKDDAGNVILKDDAPKCIGCESLSKMLHSKGIPVATGTLISQTGSGGGQIWFKLSDEQRKELGDKDLRCHTRVLRGLDLKGGGGYVVAPPSVHPNGNHYKFMNENDIKPMPDWAFKWWVETDDKDHGDDRGEVNNRISGDNIKLTPENKESLTNIFSEIYEPSYGYGNKLSLAFTGAMAIRGVDEDTAWSVIGAAITKNRFTGITRAMISDTYRRYNHGMPLMGLTTVTELIRDNKSKYKYDIEDRVVSAFHNTFPVRNILYRWGKDNENVVGFVAANSAFFVEESKMDRKGTPYMDNRNLLNIPTFRIIGVVKIDGVPRIRAEIFSVQFDDDLVGWMRRLSQLASLTSQDRKLIHMLLNNYLSEHMSDAPDIHVDPVWMEGGRVHVDAPDLDIGKILGVLRKLQGMSTNPQAFTTAMAWTLFAPLSFYFRQRERPVPFMVNSGMTEAGKTYMLLLFVQHGYNQPKEKCFMGANSVATIFTSSTSISDSIMPIIFDDISVSFFTSNKEWLKNIYLGTVSGKRGRPDQQLNTYMNKRNVSFTTNDEMEVEKAEINRFLIERFSDEHVNRQNTRGYLELAESLEDGFWLTVFREIFAEKQIDDIIAEMFNVVTRSEWNYVLREYCVRKINELCDKYGVEKFDDEYKTHIILQDWASIIFHTVLSHHQNMIDAGEIVRTPIVPHLTKQDYDVIKTGSEIRIYLTRSGFEYVRSVLRSCPYNTMTDVANNRMATELTVSPKSHRFGNGNPPDRSYMFLWTKSASDPIVVKYTKAYNGHKVGEEDIVERDEADELIMNGYARTLEVGK